MRRQMGVFVAACFYYSGLVKLARWWRQRSGPRLIILAYHRAAGGDLRSHLLYLRRHYRMLHLEEALKELYTPSQDGKHRRDQRTLLVLTFDDGYHDNYTHAFALAQQLQVPITIFLIPGYVESGDYFWWQEAKRLAQHSQVYEVKVEAHAHQLDQPEERNRLAQTIDAQLRHAGSVAEREAFLAAVREAVAVPSSIAVEEEATLPLTWAEIREMDRSGWVSFCAHTMHHPILAYMSGTVVVHR